jgi:UDP-glucose 4-epimerase
MTQPVHWADPLRARDDLRQGIRDLAARSDGGEWNIAWCAGAGVFATGEEQLRSELAQFTGFLEDLASLGPPGERGAIFLASSAGGLYSGSPDRPPFTEASVVRPLVAYGQVKVSMESALVDYAAQSGAVALIGRIANLYGPGQDLGKPQGLISHLCLTYASTKPLTIYVPLDTIRDYVFAEDVGELVAAGLWALRDRAASDQARVITKIVASGHGVTIGWLLGEATRLYKRRPRVVVRAPLEGTGQARDLRLRSVVWPELDAHLRCDITVGMAQVGADIDSRARRGRPAGQQWQ